MPRDASETRAKLLREATRIFAERGVYQATMREITTAAGQRNSSAIAYHFGSRQGVLWAILASHNETLDAHRAELIREPVGGMDVRDLVAALVIPYSSELTTDEGRDYLRIVAQLTELFPAWRDGPLSPPALRRTLAALEEQAGGSSTEARRERVVHVVMLLTTAMADRARALSSGAPTALDHVEFVTNLTDVMTGAIQAPSGAHLVARPLVAPAATAG